LPATHDANVAHVLTFRNSSLSRLQLACGASCETGPRNPPSALQTLCYSSYSWYISCAAPVFARGDASHSVSKALRTSRLLAIAFFLTITSSCEKSEQAQLNNLDQAKLMFSQGMFALLRAAAPSKSFPRNAKPFNSRQSLPDASVALPKEREAWGQNIWAYRGRLNPQVRSIKMGFVVLHDWRPRLFGPCTVHPILRLLQDSCVW
jgi:hypothetical protein